MPRITVEDCVDTIIDTINPRLNFYMFNRVTELGQTRHSPLIQAPFPPNVITGNNAEIIEGITNFPTETIPTKYVCPLSRSIMSDPTYIHGDVTGQRFERSWITEWLNKHGSHPTTREKFQSIFLQPDTQLRQAINEFTQAAEAVATNICPRK